MNILLLSIPAAITTYPLIGQVRAGFPSPAAEYEESPLNIHQWLVRHEAATFLLRYGGATLPEEHICTGDVLVVDRSLSPMVGDIIVAVLHGEMRVFTWRGKTDRHEGEGWLVWGVITGIARKRHHP